VAKKKKQPREPLLSEDAARGIRIVLGVLFILVALYTFATLLSYIFHWREDMSLLSDAAALKSAKDVANIGGKLGLKWAYLLIARLLGFGAFTIPIFLGLLGVYCLNIKRINLFRSFTICILGAIIFSVFSTYVFALFNSVEILGGVEGGSYGYFANQWLCSQLGLLGAGCVIFLALIIWSFLLSPKVSQWFDTLIFNTTHRPEKEKSEEFEDPLDEEDDDFEEHLRENTDALSDETANLEDEDSLDERVTVIKPEPVVIPGEDDGDVSLTIEDSGNDFQGNLTEEELARLYDPRLDLPYYEMPPLSLLEDYKSLWHEATVAELEKNKQRIVDALANYKIGVLGITASRGPTVTLYKIHLAEGVKVAQVRSLEEDISISLGTKGVRVITLTDSVGIEVPNEKQSTVPLKSVLNCPQFKAANMQLPLALGVTVTNEPFFLDLAKMPHLLVAGATGMGKSVGLNCIVASLLYCKHPAEIKFVMVDPKKVELALYSKLERHFLAKLPDGEEAVITDTKKVVNTLKSLCIEMDDRYELLKQADVRQIKDYNEKFLNRRLNPAKGHKFLPYIVVVIDEFADLITTAGREIEEPIARLAQKARAIGIHLVLATQRPTTDIITGTIRANFNARIAFKVNTSVDSRTIIDTPGANHLIGRGDMLAMGPNIELTRVQCAYIDKEVEKLVKFIGAQTGYSQPFLLPDVSDEEDGEDGGSEVDLRKRDKLFEEAAKIVVQYQQGSTSLLQRKLNLGYNRAGRLIDQLEAAGIVGPYEGSKARNVLITDFDTLDRKLDSLDHQTII